MIQALLLSGGQMVLDRVLANDRVPITGATKAGIFFVTLSAFLCLLAFVFLALAFHAYLLTQYTPDQAAMIAALGIMAVSIISLAIGIMFMKSRHKRVVTEHPLTDSMDLVKELMALGGDEIKLLIQENPKTAVTLASILGAVLARK